MTLLEYRAANGLTLRALADLFGVEGVGRVRNVQRWVVGARLPELRMMRHIEAVTHGAVSVADWPDRANRSDRWWDQTTAA